MNNYGILIIRYRWWIFALTLAFVLLASSGMRFLTFTSEYRYFFSKDDPQLNAFEALQKTYTKNDNVLFALAPKNGEVFTMETLAAVEELTRRAWQTPHSIRVDSLTNFQNTYSDGEELIVEDLVKDAHSLTKADIERIRQTALSEPLLVNRLISPKGHVTGVNITVNLPGKSNAEVGEVVAFARKTADDFQKKHPDMEIHLTGVVFLDNAFAEASQDDIKNLYPLMFIVIASVMVIMLRSLAGTFSALIIIIFGALTAMGFAGWLGVKLSPPSITAPIIILTIGVIDSIHVLTTMFHEMRSGRNKNDAIVESLRVNLKPLWLTAFNTMIGFFFLNFSDTPPFNDLGNIVAAGVIASVFFATTFLPALLSVLPFKVKAKNQDKKRYIEKFAETVVNNRRRVFVVMVIATVILTAGIFKNEVYDQFTEFFDKSYDFRKDTDFVTENLTGIYTIEYSLGSGEKEGISRLDYLYKIEGFAEWYRKQPGVLHVNILTDTVKRINRNMHGDDDSYYRLPESRELTAQYLLLYEMSLPYGLDLNNQINVDKSATRFIVTLKDVSTKELIGLEAMAQKWLSENAPESMSFKGTSSSVMFSHISYRNIKSMLGGTALEFLVISGILMLYFRSVKLGLVSLIPNFTPAFMAFGVWGIFVGQVGMAVSVIVAMTFGIVVDDTIHFLGHYRRARSEHGMEPKEAVIHSFGTVGTAMWVSTLILIAGFFVLRFSGFAANSDMGLLTAITVAFALLLDFLLLPTLLLMLEEKKP